MAILDILIIDDRSDERSEALFAVLRGLGLEKLYREAFDERWFDDLLEVELLGAPPKTLTKHYSIVICDDHFRDDSGEMANALGFFFALKDQPGGKPPHSLWIRKSAVLKIGTNAQAYDWLGVENADGTGWQKRIEQIVREWLQPDAPPSTQPRWRASRAGARPVAALRARKEAEDDPRQDLNHQVYFDVPPSERRSVELQFARPIRRVVHDPALPVNVSRPRDLVSLIGLDPCEPWRAVIESYCRFRGCTCVTGPEALRPRILIWRSASLSDPAVQRVTPSVLVVLSGALPQAFEANWLQRGVDTIVWSRRESDEAASKFAACFLATLAITCDVTVSAYIAAAASGKAREYRVLSRSDSEWGFPPANPGEAVYFDVAEATVEVSAEAATLERTINRVVPFMNPAQFRTDLARAERRIAQILLDGRAVGTGFLVGPDVILTAHHVVTGKGQLTARFDYAPTSQPRLVNIRREKILATAPNAPFAQETSHQGPTDESHLDYAFLRVEEQPSRDDVLGAERGHFQLSRNFHRFLCQDTILILGHPLASHLQLSLASPSDAHLTPSQTRVRYQTNTEEGSSGSPVFNGDWQVVALHHASGSLDARAFNQGVPISRIALDLRRRTLASLDELATVLRALVQGQTASEAVSTWSSCYRLTGAAVTLWPEDALAVRGALRDAGEAIGITSVTPGGMSRPTAKHALDRVVGARGAWSEP